jgi:hypothetical protein
VQTGEVDPAPPTSTSGDTGTDASRTTIRKPTAGSRAPLAVTVTDAAGSPVEGALVAIEGVRATTSGRKHLLGKGPRLQERTDADGEASVRYPVTVLGGDTTAFVSFTVEHPDFFGFRETDHPVGNASAVATLRRGAQVVVSGWIEDPDEVIRGIEPELSIGARVPQSSGTNADVWRSTPDGRLAAARFLPGRHALLLTYVAPDGARYTSELATFELADTEHKELHLQLLPARSLEGRLSFDVARPITSGRVLVALQSGNPRRPAPRIHLRREAAVAADGTFRIDGLAPMQGEIVASCDGWVSALLPTRDLERLGVTRADDEVIAEAQRRLGERALSQQEFDASADAGPFVLEMQPAPLLVVEVLAPDETPLAGARVTVLARVQWNVGVSEPWVGTLGGTTDESGRVTFTALPPGVHEVLVEHERFSLPAAEPPNEPGEHGEQRGQRGGRSDRGRMVTLEAGLEELLAIRMERP